MIEATNNKQLEMHIHLQQKRGPHFIEEFDCIVENKWMRMQLRQGNRRATLIRSNSKFVFCLFVLSINIHNGIQGMKMVAKIFVSIH
jgi:hypothetical protein